MPRRLSKLVAVFLGVIAPLLASHAHAHGVTLAKEQYDYTIAKIARMGLESQVKIELRECRTITEPQAYDRIAQVGMFEHVGIANHEAFFKQMHRLLYRDGLTLDNARAAIEALRNGEAGAEGDADVQQLLDFLTASTRGIVR